ncbi:LacI family DNA-binding transcriptional regulator [Tessaracoccus lubricantis]|uniref:LacI family DNA-binding transcriptional regulator n=1 Tax=Tessaracoccus lubricantis TaxID=545543 RepID=UPI0031ED8E7B
MRTGKVRLSDVAKAAGVSSGTVSNTINRPDSVSEVTKRKVMAAIRKLDFVPNEGAATLRSGTSKLLGLVIPDVTSSFYAEIAKGVARRAETLGYAMLLFNTDDDPGRELHQLEILARHRSIGALIVPRLADEQRLARLRELGMHMVLIDRTSSDHDGCSVSIDDVRGGYLAGQHLVRLGRSRLAYVGGPEGVPQAERRLQGFRRAQAAAGMTLSTEMTVRVENPSYAGGEEAASLLLATETLPDGIFCLNDQMAVGLLNGLVRAGVDVPRQTAVIGYGDSAAAQGAVLPLTTIHQPMIELGAAAVNLLLAEAEGSGGDHTHSSTVFNPRIVVRRSAPSQA